MAAEPTTLQEATIYFDDHDNCLNYMGIALLIQRRRLCDMRELEDST